MPDATKRLYRPSCSAETRRKQHDHHLSRMQPHTDRRRNYRVLVPDLPAAAEGAAEDQEGGMMDSYAKFLSGKRMVDPRRASKARSTFPRY